MTKTTVISIFVVAILTACSNTSSETSSSSQEKETPISEAEQNSIIESGKTIAENTFKTLGGNLKNAMVEGGVENAIRYCNANASHLMDSIGEYYYADVRRTSNKLRNPNNSPTEAEQAILNKYLAGEEQGPIVEVLPSGNKVFYAPIKTKPLCITCHGTVGKTITDNDYATILEHYPNDKAVDYEVDEFRGIWSIELKK